MGIDIRHESALTLSAYARIPIAFEVSEIFDVAPEQKDQFTLGLLLRVRGWTGRLHFFHFP